MNERVRTVGKKKRRVRGSNWSEIDVEAERKKEDEERKRVEKELKRLNPPTEEEKTKARREEMIRRVAQVWLHSSSSSGSGSGSGSGSVMCSRMVA